VEFEMRPGEAVGLLGESGCGKTSLALALLRVHAQPASVESGSIEFEGRELLHLKEKEMRKIRGARISMIPQEAGIALNPVVRAGTQIAEVIRAHARTSPRTTRKELRTQVEALLVEVGLADTARFYSAYPHQLSGGQKQRVAIAHALACKPALIVADEPTSSLDGPAQAKILDMMKDLKDRMGTSLLFITHNPLALTGLVDRVMVMYAGRIIEEGTTGQILNSPVHPYTKGLLAALPKRFDFDRARSRRSKYLPTIAGSAPNPAQLPAGCSFFSRCPESQGICLIEDPKSLRGADNRKVECFVHGS
jgi:oligopeptide/dipeptide ABC transporter ATP-binding protein